jgi:hypothetical protein
MMSIMAIHTAKGTREVFSKIVVPGNILDDIEVFHT